MAPLSLALHATCDLCTQRIGEETLKNIGVQSPKKRNSRTQEDIWKTASDSQWLKITLKCRILKYFVSTETSCVGCKQTEKKMKTRLKDFNLNARVIFDQRDQTKQ